MGRRGGMLVLWLIGSAVAAPTAHAQAEIVPPPPNDDIVQAAAISPGSRVPADTRSAGVQPGEPLTTDPKCSPTTGQPVAGGQGIGATVWYQVTGNGKRLAVDTFGSQVDPANSTPPAGFDTILAVYKGTTPSTAAGIFVSCNDDFSVRSGQNTVHSRVRFQTEAGQTYLIQAGSYDGPEPGFDRGTIHVSLFEQPANDDGANAEVLAPGEY